MRRSVQPTGCGRRWYRRWVLWRRVTAGVFLSLLMLARFEWFPWFRGTTSGTMLLDMIPFVDPLAAVELLVASRSITTTVVIGAGILILVSVLLGPIFCGFVCPLGLMLDLNQTLRRVFRSRVLQRSKRHPVSKAVPHWFRYAILGLLVGFAFVTGIPLFQAISPINMLVRALALGSLVGLVAVGAIVALEWFLPRVWCRALCPLGACYSILGRRAIWRVWINPKTSGQIRCKQCQIRCPMGIEIMDGYTLPGHESITHPSCIRCGDCVDICPNSVLGLRFRPFPPDQSSQDDPDLHLQVLESVGTEATETVSSCSSCEHLAMLERSR